MKSTAKSESGASAVSKGIEKNELASIDASTKSTTKSHSESTVKQ